MIATKICGITRPEDAFVAESFGATAIGLIFYDKSSRNVSVKIGKDIADAVKNVKIIGVFVNQQKHIIDETINEISLNGIQLHGDESPEFCAQFDVPVIKAFRIKANFDFNRIRQYKVSAILFDTFTKDKFGGTGINFDWSLVQRQEFALPIILSGGLNINNIYNGIEQINPDAVDINSSVEDLPGIKNQKKIEDIFSQLQETNNTGYNFE